MFSFADMLSSGRSCYVAAPPPVPHRARVRARLERAAARRRHRGAHGAAHAQPARPHRPARDHPAAPAGRRPSAGRSPCPSNPSRFRAGVSMGGGMDAHRRRRAALQRGPRHPRARWPRGCLPASRRASPARHRRACRSSSCSSRSTWRWRSSTSSPSRRSTAAASSTASCRAARARVGGRSRGSRPSLLLGLVFFGGGSSPGRSSRCVRAASERLSRHRLTDGAPHDRTQPPHRRLRHAPHRPPAPRPPARRPRQLGEAPGEPRCYFFSADWHALTTSYHETDEHQAVRARDVRRLHRRRHRPADGPRSSSRAR